MSWIVQNLWSNRDKIKNRTRQHNDIAYDYAMMSGMSEFDDDKSGYDDPFIESDEFNDLLVIEKAIEELKELNLLSQDDMNVLNEGGQGRYTNDNRKRKTESRHFYSVCDRIAYYLGGYFTDEGYLSYLTKKHNLTSEQVKLLRAFMRSKFKNKILSKGYKIENNHEETRTVSAEV